MQTKFLMRTCLHDIYVFLLSECIPNSGNVYVFMCTYNNGGTLVSTVRKVHTVF